MCLKISSQLERRVQVSCFKAVLISNKPEWFSHLNLCVCVLVAKQWQWLHQAFRLEPGARSGAKILMTLEVPSPHT